MGELQHVYLTVHGEWTSASWIGEKAQFGVRLAIVDDTNPPAKGSTFTLPLSGEVVADTGTTAGTHGTLNRTWTARLGPTGSPENADAAWQVDLAEDAWTFINAISGSIHPGFKFTHVKIAPVLASGAYGGPASTYTLTTPYVGTGTGAALPPECSIAVTWRAPILGRRGRGRIYIPSFSVGNPLETDGTVKSSYRSTLANAAKTFITDLENGPGTEEYTPLLVVMSAGSATGVRPLECRVGSHWDVQRRRQAQVPEVYTSLAF